MATSPEWYTRVTYGSLEVPASSGCEKHLPISQSKSTQGQQKGSCEVLASHTCARGMVCTNSWSGAITLRAHMSSSAGEIGKKELLGRLCEPVLEGSTLQMCDVPLHVCIHSQYWSSILLS